MINEILSILFPYIIILYLIDSIQLINKSHILFVNYIGKKYYLKENGFHISKLSPIGITILSHNMPVYFTTNGIYKLKDERSYEEVNCEADDYYFISYHNIDKVVADGKEVRVNGEKYFKAPSSISANIIKNRINDIKTVKPAKRIIKVQKIFNEMYDINKIEALSHSHLYYLKYIQVFSLFFFVNTFVILPSILYTDIYLYINIYLIVIYIVITYIIILIMTFFVHRKIYKTEKKQRLYALLSMIFLPVSAMHATNYITTDLYANFNYLAISALLLPSDIFLRLVRKELLLIGYRKSIIDNIDLYEYWELAEKSLTNLIKEAGFTTNSVFAVQNKQDENATCYCPICLSEYINDVGECSDCRIELKKY